MQYRVTHLTAYSYSETVPVCHNVVHLAPRSDERQQCLQHRLTLRPRPASLASRLDFFGNTEHYFALQGSHRRLLVKSESFMEILPPKYPDPASTPPWEQVRDGLCTVSDQHCLEAAQFVYDSPMIGLIPSLREYALPSFHEGRPILSAVLDLAARIFHEFRYDPKATTVNSQLEEVMELRRGVCQDFAHLQIGCLRAMGLAARYVSGYIRTLPAPGQKRLVGVDASHAWLSVYCGGGTWVDVDPTNNLLVDDRHIVTAWGRDYSDVCPIKGVFIGGGHHKMQVSVDVMPEDEFPQQLAGYRAFGS